MRDVVSDALRNLSANSYDFLKQNSLNNADNKNAFSLDTFNEKVCEFIPGTWLAEGETDRNTKEEPKLLYNSKFSQLIVSDRNQSAIFSRYEWSA